MADLVIGTCAGAVNTDFQIWYKGVQVGTLESPNTIAPSDVRNVPSISFPTEENTFYTLVFCDPDAPSVNDPKFGQWLHWLVVNIPDNGVVSLGTTLAEYSGSGPGPDSGEHKYTFVLLKQSKELPDIEAYQPRISARSGFPPRRHFNVQDFAKKYNMEVIGFRRFLASNDAYVATVAKYLTSNITK